MEGRRSHLERAYSDVFARGQVGGDVLHLLEWHLGIARLWAAALGSERDDDFAHQIGLS